jgi:hypothetical protein
MFYMNTIISIMQRYGFISNPLILDKYYFEMLNPEDRKVFYLDNPLQAKRSSGYNETPTSP